MLICIIMQNERNFVHGYPLIHLIIHGKINGIQYQLKSSNPVNVQNVTHLDIDD